mmetsp:Transcript_34974/g.79851  ORF Transcript_34974/g.79851 Transcript_34974/m.79851 type:complete len:254 (+) Transcript_34974:948-1709(+)
MRVVIVRVVVRVPVVRVPVGVVPVGMIVRVLVAGRARLEPPPPAVPAPASGVEEQARPPRVVAGLADLEPARVRIGRCGLLHTVDGLRALRAALALCDARRPDPAPGVGHGARPVGVRVPLGFGRREHRAVPPLVVRHRPPRAVRTHPAQPPRVLLHREDRQLALVPPAAALLPASRRHQEAQRQVADGSARAPPDGVRRPGRHARRRLDDVDLHRTDPSDTVAGRAVGDEGDEGEGRAAGAPRPLGAEGVRD